MRQEATVYTLRQTWIGKLLSKSYSFILRSICIRSSNAITVVSTFTECPAPGKESSIEHERRRKLQERKCDVLASRIHTLEDALLLEAGDTHPLLAESRQADTSYYIHSESASKTSWMGHQMDAGTLLIKGRQAQTLLGGVAAEVRFTMLTSHLNPKTVLKRH